MAALPPGFVESASGPVRLIVSEAWAEAIGALDLRRGFAALLERREVAGEGRGAVSLLEVRGPHQRLLVRSYLHGGLLGPLLGRAYLGLGRALTELRVTASLRAAGAPVPEPVLAAGEPLFGPFWAPLIATVYEEGTIDGLAFLQSAPDRPTLLAAARAAGRAVRVFHDAGGRHPDLHIKNLLLRPRDAGPEVLVIDLDRARVTPGLTPGERMAQIMRLFRSLLKRELLGGVGPRGLAAFFGAYCGSDRSLRRALLRRVGREQRKVALHALRYRKGGSARPPH
ncbi:MAG: hypothetical protein CL910_05115 [Deltaproteobacteria bacterium]|nr:hypothetical protein [Deltaproteobacteria bacterium]